MSVCFSAWLGNLGVVYIIKLKVKWPCSSNDEIYYLHINHFKFVKILYHIVQYVC